MINDGEVPKSQIHQSQFSCIKVPWNGFFHNYFSNWFKITAYSWFTSYTSLCCTLPVCQNLSLFVLLWEVSKLPFALVSLCHNHYLHWALDKCNSCNYRIKMKIILYYIVNQIFNVNLKTYRLQEHRQGLSNLTSFESAFPIVSIEYPNWLQKFSLSSSVIWVMKLMYVPWQLLSYSSNTGRPPIVMLQLSNRRQPGKFTTETWSLVVNLTPSFKIEIFTYKLLSRRFNSLDTNGWICKMNRRKRPKQHLFFLF